MMNDTTWTYLGDWNGFEYWRADRADWNTLGDVYRRKVSTWNVTGPDGAPMGVRWDSTFPHFQRYVAGRLPV